MTAPTRTRTPRRGRTAQPNRSATRAAPARRQRTDQRGRTTAAQKAYARRAQRTAVQPHRSGAAATAPATGLGSMLRLRLPRSRASFVTLMMVLLSSGVALTLWLSTQAIADSYRLETVREQTAGLAERAERLQREVARQESAAALADKAKALGMVPSGNPARIVVTESGKPKLVGEPEKVEGAPALPQQQQQQQQQSRGEQADSARDRG
ncbi:MAG: septum formation initiator [Actinophytocola sp.]|nr:septum formation initiator [Actinophytocola sp.]